ncbi:MAG: hypothetical protein WC343_12950 [Bacilli bacterium]|jgi:hypothetical protein
MISFRVSKPIRSRVCCVCGQEIVGTRHGPYNAGNGRTEYACDNCYNQSCLWFPDRPDCKAFAEKVLAARAAESSWGISPDIR